MSPIDEPHLPYTSRRPRSEFYAFLVRRKIPYVFLSNTGAKGSQGTQSKLAKMGFMMQHRPVPLRNIYTAAQAQVAYMVRSAPRSNPPPPRPLTPQPAAAPLPSLPLALAPPTHPPPHSHRHQVKAVPRGARVFVIAGGASSPGGIEDSFWMQLLREQACAG